MPSPGAYVVEEYPQRNPDGTEIWVKRWSDGSYTSEPISGGSSPSTGTPGVMPPSYPGMGGYPVVGGEMGLDGEQQMAQFLADLMLRDWSTRANVTGYHTVYQTANGQMSVDQMREELAMSDPVWKTKSNTEVIAEYGKVTGTPVQTVQTPTLGREQYYANLAAQLSGPRDWIKYQNMMAQMPEGSMGGLEDVFKRQLAWGAVSPTDSWENAFARFYAGQQAQPRQATPSPEPAPQPAPPPAAQPSPQPAPPQAPQPSPGLPGPPANATPLVPPQAPPPVTYLPPPQAPQPGTMTASAQSSGTQPAARTASTAGANTFTPDAFGQGAAWQGQDAWYQPGLSGRPSQSQSGGMRYNGVIQPHKISALDYSRMTPTQKQMLSGEWQSQGLDANDMWERMRRAMPRGSASLTTTWR
jgi:hypothetical protein